MKKISLLLTLVMLISMLSVSAFAKAEIPITAEYSYTENGNIKVTVFTSNVKKLVSLNVVLIYDTSIISLQSAKACVTCDSEGNETENFSGLWVFGELKDKTGCTGAFISFNGVTKSGNIPACEFVLSCEKGEISPSDITVMLKELVTDDGDEENDIYESVNIPLGKENYDATADFDYIIRDVGVVINGVKSIPQVCFVPDVIQGLPVRSLLFENPFESPFVVFGRSVLTVKGNVFSENNIVIASESSAPVATAKISGSKYLEYSETVTPDLTENIFYTHKYFSTSINEMFRYDCEIKLTPSHKAFEEYIGTGTKIVLVNGENSAEFLLCVMGDANGDSVCDVLDAVMVKGCANKQIDLEKIQQRSVDFNNDGEVNAHDYAQSVNVALGEEIKVFDGVWGDLNGDYCVDILDLFEINKFINNSDLSEDEIAKADFNNDGIINNKDKEILNELIEEFE